MAAAHRGLWTLRARRSPSPTRSISARIAVPAAWSKGPAAHSRRRRAILANGSSLTFGANDAVSYLQLNGGSSATTASSGNVTGKLEVFSGSTLTLGANLTLSNEINVQGSGSTLNMAGYSLNAQTVTFGYNGIGSPPVTIENRGAITATYLYTGNGNFNINSGDSITNYYLSHGTTTLNGSVTNLELDSNSAATTTATGAPTANASVYTGSTLTLGANLTLSSTLDVEGTGSTFDMGGHTLNANFVGFGFSGTTPVTIENRGAIDDGPTSRWVTWHSISTRTTRSPTSYLNNASTTLNASVSVSYLELDHGSVATTTAVGNVTSSILVDTGSTLNLGCTLNLSGSLDVRNYGSVVNMNGNPITAGEISLGVNGSTAVTLNRGGDGGTLTANDSLSIGQENFKLVAGDSIFDLDVVERAIVTTAATGNINDAAFVESGGKLILGADFSVNGGFITVQDSGSILDAQGHAIATDTVYVGVFGNSAVSLINLGLVTLNTLGMDHGSTMTLHGGDTINTPDLPQWRLGAHRRADERDRVDLQRHA